MLPIAFITVWLLLLLVTRRHPKRIQLWVAESTCLLLCAGYTFNWNISWGAIQRPWRIYVDQSASMSWGNRDAKAHELTQQLQGDVIYFSSELSKASQGPTGEVTNLQPVFSDWEQVWPRFAGVVLISDGVFKELPSKYVTPWNCVQLTDHEEVVIPTIEAPLTAEVGKPITIQTQAQALLWINGEQLVTSAGKAVWTPLGAGKVTCYAQIGKGTSSKEIHVVSSDPPYILRIIAGIDPAVPAARNALPGLNIALLQWNGKSWRWGGKTADNPQWATWWGQSEWVWLDAVTWSQLPPDAQAAIWKLWEGSSQGIYFASNGPVTQDWQGKLPGKGGRTELWGFSDTEWGPKVWSRSNTLTNLTLGSQVPGPGFAFHTAGKHRIVQHTGTDWQLGLTKDTQLFWSRMSAWLAEGKRPQAQIGVTNPKLKQTASVSIQVRDSGLEQLRVLVSPLDKPAETKLIIVTPDTLHAWRGQWKPEKAGLYRIVVTGSGSNGPWQVEEVFNVPPAVDELQSGQFPAEHTMLHLAAASKGSYQKDEFNSNRLVAAKHPAQRLYLRNYPGWLGLAGMAWLWALYLRLKFSA